jgi:hypothetical protein
MVWVLALSLFTSGDCIASAISTATLGLAHLPITATLGLAYLHISLSSSGLVSKT